MATPELPPERLVFGPFELDLPGRLLRKRGIPVRLSGQPFQILLMLLESPGEIVTREQLRERVWGTGTFVDFEGGLNAAINKLRRALGETADDPRYIETITGSGYRFIGTVDAPAAETPPPARSSVEAPVRHRLSRLGWIALAGAILIAVLLFRKPEAPAGTPVPLKLIRLTKDDGYADAPALSPDGKFLAYSSGPGLTGERDLFIKAIAGGTPVRLTFDGAVNTAPDFSPDGTRIVFQSMRNSPGIFEIPAFGGEPRLIVQNGFNPRFSPDGTEIAYWIGAPSVADSVPGSGSVWIVPAAGGKPRRVGAEFTTARFPIWSRDGKHLLINGYSSSKTFDKFAVDWWFISASGGESIRTGAYQALLDAGLATRSSRTPVPSIPAPQCWSAQEDKVTFSARNGDTRNLWQIGISSVTGTVMGSPDRLTVGTGNDAFAACAAGVVAFSSDQSTSGPWLIPFDFARRRPKADPQRIASQASRDSPSLTANGRFLAFASDQSGKQNIWLRDLSTGKESIVASSPFVQRFPLSNKLGTRVAYSVYENDKRVLYISALGGPPERLCDGCLRATDWAEDDKTLIVFGGNPYSIHTLDIASLKQNDLVKHSVYNVLYGRIAPDRRWISFTARMGADVGRIAIAPLDHFNPVAESSWIPIVDVGTDDYAMWSPDGTALYYTSSKDGHACLWGQRLDSAHAPSGEPFSVQHFHGEASFGHGGWAVGEDLIAIALVAAKGNIWMLSR